MNLKGKQLSLAAKILALVFLLCCFIVMIAAKIEIPIDDAIKVSTFIALVFSPVDVSLWIENLRGLRMRKIDSADEDGSDE